MPHRTVSWNTLSRSLHDSQPQIPAGLLTPRAQIQGFARFQRRPLVVAGKFDRSAIMAAAAVAATGLQERYGCPCHRQKDTRSVGTLRGDDTARLPFASDRCKAPQ